VGDEKFLPDMPEKLVPHDIPVLISITEDEGGVIAGYIDSENGFDELNNNLIEYLPHLLDYNNRILDENLFTKTAHDIKEFYFGDKPISEYTKRNFADVS